MARTVTNNKRTADPTLLLLAEEGWQFWTFPPGSAPQVQGSHASPDDAPLTSRTTLALPVQQVFALPLWLATTDDALLEEMVLLQIEGRGLLNRSRGETTLDYRVVARAETETLVLAMVLPGNLPQELCQREVRRYEPSPRVLPLPPDRFTFWREGEHLVMAVTRGNELVYFQTMSDRSITPLVEQEIRCVQLQLEAQNVTGSSTGITAWGHFAPEEIDSLQEIAGGTAELGPRPAPALLPQPLKLIPHPVRIAHSAREQTGRKTKLAALVAAVYLLVAALFVAQYAWMQFQVWRLRSDLAGDAPLVTTIRETAEKWNSMELALNPEFYPAEQLLRCASALPADGVRFTWYEQQEARIFITGEASDATASFRFVEVLKQNDDLIAYDWRMPQPTILPNGNAQFQLEGLRGYALTQ